MCQQNVEIRDFQQITALKGKVAAPAELHILIDIQARMQKINSPGFERLVFSGMLNYTMGNTPFRVDLRRRKQYE